MELREAVEEARSESDEDALDAVRARLLNEIKVDYERLVGLIDVSRDLGCSGRSGATTYVSGKTAERNRRRARSRHCLKDNKMALLQIAEPGESAAPHEHRLAIGIDLGTTNLAGGYRPEWHVRGSQ